MATTYQSVEVARGDQPRAVKPGVCHAYGKFTLTAALVINDVIQMCQVPNGARILDISLTTDDLDTNGSPAIVLNVGDGNLTDRFIKQQTTAQAGGIVRLGAGVAATLQSGANGYRYTADDTIDVLVQAAPATGATSGDITMVVMYTLD